MNPAPRVAAARAAAAVFAGGRNLDDAFAQHTADLGDADRGLAKAIAYGVVRERRGLEALLALMLEKPLHKEPEVQALLMCGLYQLRSMRVAEHAAVGETVAATQLLNKPWARGLCNAVLRRYQREHDALDAAAPRDYATRWSYPDWLLSAIKVDWGSKAESIFAAGNEAGPLTLRINRRRTTREEMLQRFAAADLAAIALNELPDAIRLTEPLAVERIPGFAEGLVSVQDASAQLAAPLLDVHAGMRVLDACAAPGGKAAHLLELQPDLNLLAVDSDAERLTRVESSLSRLNLHAELLCADAARPSIWAGTRRFDRILIDAPCSGTGVIRRHPDIKWLRRSDDIPRLATQQRRLLDALWTLLAPGGVMVYATCSLLSAEGEDVVSAFVENTPSADHWPIEAQWGEACMVGRRIPPGGDYDGFYYARLRKSV